VALCGGSEAIKVYITETADSHAPYFIDDIGLLLQQQRAKPPSNVTAGPR
jgi:hypothetical protein